jgi:hypothetical protein
VVSAQETPKYREGGVAPQVQRERARVGGVGGNREREKRGCRVGCEVIRNERN